MNKYLSVFRSQYGENLVMMAYDKLMNSWPLPYQDIYIDSKLGSAHLIVSSTATAHPICLIHAFYASAASWYQNSDLLTYLLKDIISFFGRTNVKTVYFQSFL